MSVVSPERSTSPRFVGYESNRLSAAARERDIGVDAPKSASVARVLHVINGEDYSGAERVQDSLALALPAFGFEVAFVSLKPGIFADARRSRETPHFEAAMRSKFDLRPAREVARLIRRGKFDLVHTHSARNALVGRPAAALAGAPLVHHVHCQTSTEVDQRWRTKANFLLERLSLVGAAGVIAVSPTLEAYLLARGYSRRKLWLVPNGVPTLGEPPPRQAPRGTWTVGVVAMFRPRKGIETLLTAIAIARRAGRATRLLAVGRFQSPAYEAQVKNLAHELGLDDAIEWTGFQQDVTSQLARMDVFVLPSLISEAMPMSVLEAMAAGVPVIGSRVDGVTDLIEHGESGWLVNPGQADELAHTLGMLGDGALDWTGVRRRAQERQRERFSEESMAASVARVYREILGPRRSKKRAKGATESPASDLASSLETRL